MTPFRRRAQPVFWAAKEAQWLGSDRTANPLTWQHETKTLAFWFQKLARAEGEPADRCAYCEAPLRDASRATTDHFYPRGEFPEWALTWINLFPACDQCNSVHKRDQWSCRILRPDEPQVDEFFAFDPLTGRVEPNPSRPARDRARARVTARVLGLNTAERRHARLRCWRDLSNAWKAPDHDLVRACAAQGPYRFVGQWFLRSVAPIS